MSTLNEHIDLAEKFKTEEGAKTEAPLAEATAIALAIARRAKPVDDSVAEPISKTVYIL